MTMAMTGRWLSSVVRMSIIGWQTFPDLFTICGRQVTTIQLSINQGSVIK